MNSGLPRTNLFRGKQLGQGFLVSFLGGEELGKDTAAVPIWHAMLERTLYETPARLGIAQSEFAPGQLQSESGHVGTTCNEHL
jgi:hypothetical protein